MLMAITIVLAALVALQWGYNPLLVVAVNGFLLVIELIFETGMPYAPHSASDVPNMITAPSVPTASSQFTTGT
jgi:hypothetical protein